MAGIQPGEAHIVIDSVVWAQYINATDTQTDKQTDSHTSLYQLPHQRIASRGKNSNRSVCKFAVTLPNSS